MTSNALVPDFLTRFKCLGTECEDTCCKGWNMQVDTGTQARYRNLAPELMQSITGESDDAIMRRDPKSDFCVKLEGGLCAIQSKYGENFLGDACYFYPRSTRKLGEQVMMTATLSCPEIARLTLFGENAFIDSALSIDRLPLGIQDYLPSGFTPGQALAIHRAFLDAALKEGAGAERIFMRIFAATESLSRITQTSWPDAVPFYLEHADTALPLPEPRATDPFYLLQALCGLVGAAKYAHHTRLMQTIHDMERALHIQIRWDNFAFSTLPDYENAAQSLEKRWKEEWQAQFAPLLKRYLAMQLSLALFPFAGFGNTLQQRAAIIGIRLATVRLALMSICDAANGAPAERDVVRVVQSLSRFLDHLGGAEFSLKIYEETGWLQGKRLRSLLGDC